jgi:hypothetical protein
MRQTVSGGDLGGAEAVEEAHRKEEGKERDGAGVVGVDDGVGTSGGGDLLEAVGDGREGGVPRYGLEAAFPLGPDTTQRSGQTRLRVAPFTVIADRALGAQLAAAHGMVGIATHVGDHTAALDDGNTTGVKTVAWTGSADDFLDSRHRISPFVPRVIGRSPHSTMSVPIMLSR